MYNKIDDGKANWINLSDDSTFKVQEIAQSDRVIAGQVGSGYGLKWFMAVIHDNAEVRPFQNHTDLPMNCVH